LVVFAKGHIVISGPDFIATVTDDDAYKTADLLMDKLDALLCKCANAHRSQRNGPVLEPDFLK